MRHGVAAILMSGLAACSAPPASTPPSPSISGSEGCITSAAYLLKDFDAGAFARCDVLDERHFKLTISPEDAPPINCSAWYAFRLVPRQPGDVTVELDYSTCGHRYWPKTSDRPDGWDRLAEDRVTITGPRRRATAELRVTLDEASVYVTGQELLQPRHYADWMARQAAHPDAAILALGRSLEARPIDALRIGAINRQRDTVLIVGRQHPPEIAGGRALLPAVERLLADDPLARAYRARFETIVIPLLNPDGVVNGHWRHNAGGVDLNRDWGPFTQPETRLVAMLLEEIAADPDRRLRLLLDYHATRFDTIYTLTDTQVTDPPEFTDRWIDAYQKRLPGYSVRTDPGHNPGLPTSKTFGYARYAIPTATYEIGDETDRSLIVRLGSASTEAMMETMLEIHQ